ncbi:MAG TPA: chitobiase/beta-hexosaminidase C-terminal domain-containing protein [Steroidobacteraceae bacterium]|nr:chitobiase/beta-hexosaminidase C-terminal domain-containing protein [Steroidobacteraceae bacterium]
MRLIASVCLCMFTQPALDATPHEASPAYGLAARTSPPPYLRMPRGSRGGFPRLLSQTGAFADTRNLVASPGLIPYDLNVAFWSDGADKRRWAAVPRGSIGFAPAGDWTFPPGSVFIKTFELPVDAANPGMRRRLETRLLVRDERGGVYGLVYKWRSDNSDAELLDTGLTEDVPVRTSTGETRSQPWYYPSRQDCLECHNRHTAGILGISTRQLNRAFTYPSGVSGNQLQAWSQLGLFDRSLSGTDVSGLTRLAAAEDATRSLEDRARSYLDANCSQCHRPGSTVASFDARFDTPRDRQGLIDGRVLIDERIDRARVIAPNDIWRSIAFMRVNTIGDIRMPPLARQTIDVRGVGLLREWITSLPGRPVVEPPQIAPPGGAYGAPVEVSLHDAEPGAEIRYTLDGSLPTASDARYEGPVKVTGSTVLRARAFKDGYTRSIVSQAIFIVGE